jgi:Flp pilus assembly protein TadD
VLARVDSPLERAAFAAYTAFLAHAAVDWDWQLPVVTGTALLLGALLVAGRARTRSNAVAAALIAAAALVAGATLVGNIALERATSVAARHHWAAAERLATQAQRWQPWSSDPLLLLGAVQSAEGRSPRASFLRASELSPNDWRAWYDLMLASRRAP